jgi:hypothetical protein
MYFRNPETRVAAGKRFEKMFLEIFRNDPSKIPPCFELGSNTSLSERTLMEVYILRKSLRRR